MGGAVHSAAGRCESLNLLRGEDKPNQGIPIIFEEVSLTPQMWRALCSDAMSWRISWRVGDQVSLPVGEMHPDVFLRRLRHRSAVRLIPDLSGLKTTRRLDISGG
jgi:hypothetical protein